MKLGAQFRSSYRVPRLAFLRRGVRIVDWQSASPKPVYAEDVDLLDAALAFAGPSSGLPEFALRAGITDTALEARTGSSRERTGTLAVVASVEDLRGYTQPASVPALGAGAVLRAVREDVARGGLVVGPAAPVTIGGIARYGWWSFSPGSAYALGKMDLGGGQGLGENAELSKLPRKVKPFIQFDGNITKCFVSTALSGLAGDDAQGELAGCATAAICDLIADLLVDKVGEVGSGLIDDEKGIAELNALNRAIFAAYAKATQNRKGLSAGCQGAINSAVK
jgi:hypothetical protein